MNMLSTVMKILKPALLSLSFCFDFLEEERKKENYFLSYLVVGPHKSFPLPFFLGIFNLIITYVYPTPIIQILCTTV